MEPVEGLRALHRRRGKDGHDQQGDLQPLPAGTPQCRGDRCGPGRSELRGDRRGGEPATRAESADAEAAGGCGRLTIVNLRDGKPTFTMNIMCSDEPGATRLDSCARGECRWLRTICPRTQTTAQGTRQARITASSFRFAIWLAPHVFVRMLGLNLLA